MQPETDSIRWMYKKLTVFSKKNPITQSSLNNHLERQICNPLIFLAKLQQGKKEFCLLKPPKLSVIYRNNINNAVDPINMTPSLTPSDD